jgi:hypothetical protein
MKNMESAEDKRKNEFLRPLSLNSEYPQLDSAIQAVNYLLSKSTSFAGFFKDASDLNNFKLNPPLITVPPQDEFKSSSYSYILSSIKPEKIFLNPKYVKRLGIANENANLKDEFNILSTLLASSILHEIAHICVRYRENIKTPSKLRLGKFRGESKGAGSLFESLTFSGLIEVAQNPKIPWDCTVHPKFLDIILDNGKSKRIVGKSNLSKLIQDREYIYWGIEEFDEFIPDEEHIIQKSICSEDQEVEEEDSDNENENNREICYPVNEYEISSISNMCEICSPTK